MTPDRSLDRHVLIVTAAGSFTTSGDRLTGPVDTVDKLEKLIEWAYQRGSLRPLPAAGDGDPEPARVWLVGAAEALLSGTPGGPDVDAGVQLGVALAPLLSRGWELSARPTTAVTLTRGHGATRTCVEILAERRPWLTGGDDAVADDAAQLGRRLQLWYAAVGALPATTAAATGAVVADHVMGARAGGRGAVLSIAGAIPDDVAVEARIQPTWCPTPHEVQQEFERSDDLVRLAQQCPQLASAGMLTLGHGPTRRLDASAAATAAAQPKRPFGLWRAALPAADELMVPAMLPPPHPWLRAGQSTQMWVTTEDLDGLAKDVRDGGAGLTPEQLPIDEAIVWQHQGRVLEGWATRLREARETLRDESTLQGLVESAATGYLTAMADPQVWSDPTWAHHFQPAWAAAIATHVRFRGRRAAMRLSREYRAWPVLVDDATMIYTPPRDETTGAPTDLSDGHHRLGRLVTTHRVALTDQTVLAVVLAEGTADVTAALTAALGVTTDDSTPAVVENDSTTESPSTAEAAAPQVAAAEETPATNGDPSPAGQDAPAPERRPRRSKATATPVGGSPAAVLDTDGLWLADGTRVDLAAPEHVGQVAQLAHDHGLGFVLSGNYSEPGQIWLSVEACEAAGVDVDAIDYQDSAKSLRELTKGIPFVTRAADAGWRFGGVAEGEEPCLGTWTRVYREDDDKRGVWVVLTAGLGDADVMPIFEGDPSPADVARRLHLLANALKFPWKINGGVTAVDLMVQARPRSWSPQDWKTVVLAPSTTEVPFGMGDVEADFNWSREPTGDERSLTYLHAYDRGGSYVAGIAGTELPIGEPVHQTGDVQFDPRVPGYYLTVVPEPEDWRQPYVLNPRGLKFHEPKWVCSPRIERARALGYDPQITEAWTWPQHSRVLLSWYERFRDASTALDVDGDPHAQAARQQSKIIRTHGIGIIGSSEYLKDKLGFSPERRLHVMAKANANITYRINDIGQRTGIWPLAVLRDTVFYASDEADPDLAWPGGPTTYGRGFGQYKPERSGLLADQIPFLNGRGYQGKDRLDPVDPSARAGRDE